MKNVVIGLLLAAITALPACNDKPAEPTKTVETPAATTPPAAMPPAAVPATPTDTAPAAAAPAAAAPTAAAPVAALDPTAEAAQIFEQRCTLCHGPTGKGDGAASAGLNPKPRDYTDGAWQKAVKDDELAKAILEGGASVGKSALMPPNPDLKDKPAVIKSLVAKVRSFAPKG